VIRHKWNRNFPSKKVNSEERLAVAVKSRLTRHYLAEGSEEGRDLKRLGELTDQENKPEGQSSWARVDAGIRPRAIDCFGAEGKREPRSFVAG